MPVYDPIQNQYSVMPYPPRAAADEKRRLLGTVLDNLEVLNQHAYRGSRDFDKGFRALVAGAGTGDSTLFLAEQLREQKGEVTHLDFAQAPIDVARERARVRQLQGISWVRASLLDLDPKEHGKFDYINASGVLHHLPDPLEGLERLMGVLAPGGAIGLMLYGAYGRMAIYPVQKLLRRIHAAGSSIPDKLADAREVLAALHESHWFNMASQRSEVEVEDSAGLYDLLLCARDQAYDVDGVYNLVESAGLEVLHFLVDSSSNVNYYDPASFLDEGAMLERVKIRSAREQQAIAELLHGGIAKHTLYVGRSSGSDCTLDELDVIPFIGSVHAYQDWYGALADLGRQIEPGGQLNMNFGGGAVPITVTGHTGGFLQALDGQRDFREIYQAMGADSDVAHVELRPLFDTLMGANFLLLRKPEASLPRRLARLAPALAPA